MLKVIYISTGMVVADHDLEDWATELVNDYKIPGEMTVPIALSSMVDMLRVQVIRGNIPYEDIVFCNGDDPEHILVNEYGKLNEWPKGFCDKGESMLWELLEYDAKAAKANRAKREEAKIDA